ncbi:hypothetical protein [Roseovarius sp. D0-M9]|uniref:hypothetical protein n=1 Tax=Roseovarius sp. D0-M9 TaxID=3127117 RepID=UPI00300F88D0
MLWKNTHVALLSSVAALALGTAHAQTTEEVDGDLDPEACVNLADRLADDSEVDSEIRTEIENVIASGNVEQCDVFFSTWEEEGTIDRETLELVARESVSERMIVQQEIEVDADVAVYQPPAEVAVDTGTPEIEWSMPRQSVSINEQAPQIEIRQGKPTVNVDVPQPRITVMIPEPEVIVTWPESTLDMSEVTPNIEVRIPEPVVSVNMPDPVIELTIGDEEPSELVQLEDGRFAPEGSTAEDLEPQIETQQQEATITRSGDKEEPEIVFNRDEPNVTFEGQEPEVTVNVIGEPEIQVSSGSEDGEANVTVREDAAEGEDEANRDEGDAEATDAADSEEDAADGEEDTADDTDAASD